MDYFWWPYVMPSWSPRRVSGHHLGWHYRSKKPAKREVICVNNGEAQLLNIDAGNQFASPTLDMAAYQCVVEKLPAVVLSGDLGVLSGLDLPCLKRLEPTLKQIGLAGLNSRSPRRWCLQLLVAVMSAISLSACSPSEVTFHTPEAYPERLSEWGLINLDRGQLQVSDQTVVYQMNTALFSDYALKLRTLYLPEGTKGIYDMPETFALPVGSIISKTFLYPKNDQGELLTVSEWDENPDAINLAQYELIETRVAGSTKPWLGRPALYLARRRRLSQPYRHNTISYAGWWTSSELLGAQQKSARPATQPTIRRKTYTAHWHQSPTPRSLQHGLWSKSADLFTRTRLARSFEPLASTQCAMGKCQRDTGTPSTQLLGY